MLLLVLESSGSSPGRQGFKMIVTVTGAHIGSIGGGMMEVKLTTLAVKCLQKGQKTPFFKKQIHRNDVPAHRSGMICSGAQTVCFYPLLPTQRPLIQNILRNLKTAQPVGLRLSLQAQSHGLDLLKDLPLPADCHLEWSGKTGFVYEERLGFKNRLYLIGGGHCALALSELMARMDFYLCVIDDRPALDTLANNNFVHEKYIVTTYDEVDRYVPEGPDVYVVVMTLGYRSDLQVLRRLLGRSFRYLGVLGSAVKVATMRETLLAEQYPAEQIEQVRGPVGVPIHSHSPEEIAISIAAELIAVKNRPGFGGM